MPNVIFKKPIEQTNSYEQHYDETKGMQLTPCFL